LLLATSAGVDLLQQAMAVGVVLLDADVSAQSYPHKGIRTNRLV
jgi:hypothetical protein